ncbi:MAG: DUF6524 family protein [Pseudomonadota bacterium]
MASRSTFGLDNFFIRFVLALILVAATYNPSGYSFYHWVVEPFVPGQVQTTTDAQGETAAQTPAGDRTFGPEKAVVGILLLIGWIIFLRATLRSLGPVGIILALAFLGSLVWLAFANGWLSRDNQTALQYVGILIVAFVLSIGLSWSHVRRRISGQADVDDIET